MILEKQIVHILKFWRKTMSNPQLIILIEHTSEFAKQNINLVELGN